MLLSARNIRTRRTSVKLGDKFLGLFSIVESVGTNVYRLNLLVKYERLYLVFHVSLLELYQPREGVASPPLIDLEGEEHFEVACILGKIIRKGGKVYYHVRWKGYPPSDDSWEPTEHLKTPRLITEFERGIQK